MGGTRWSPKELQYLKQWYRKKKLAEIAEELHRPALSVRMQASKQGLTKNIRPWTQAEYELLRKYYLIESNVELAKRIGRNPHSIRTRARMLGVARKQLGINWSVAEKKIKKHYGKIETQKLSKILKIPVTVIRRRASLMGIAVISKRWTEKEDEILRKQYMWGAAVSLATKMGRTLFSIQKRANILGLSRKEKAWSPEDDETIKSLYGITDLETIANRMKRSISSIQDRAHKLGVRRDNRRVTAP